MVTVPFGFATVPGGSVIVTRVIPLLQPVWAEFTFSSTDIFY